MAQGKVIDGSCSLNGQVSLRGMPEDFESWASMGNDQWSYVNVLPYFRKMEPDLDIRDDFHGNAGPLPFSKRHNGAWPEIQQAFHAACLDSGWFPAMEDMNSPNAAGVGRIPMNNQDGVRMSIAVTDLPPKTGPGVKLGLGWMKGGEMPRKKHTPERVIKRLFD